MQGAGLERQCPRVRGGPVHHPPQRAHPGQTMVLVDTAALFKEYIYDRHTHGACIRW